MSISVEYLTIFRRNDSFCDTTDSFIRLLEVDSKIKINRDTISYEGNHACSFQIANGEISEKKQRYFHLSFSWNVDPETNPESISSIIALLKAIRRVIAQAGGELEILWDDLAAHYARKAYPLIHEIENKMRLLITKFMLTKVGREWVDETLPREVEEAVKNSKRKESEKDNFNVLYAVDFIHLGKFLFKAYSKKNIDDLYKKLKTAKDLNDIKALQDFIPLSNWQRYFSSLVTCDDSYLSKRWEQLYELRCKVAHNALITSDDLELVDRLISEIKPTIEDAIAKLSKVMVPPEEAEDVAESMVQEVNPTIGEFISCWQEIEFYINHRLSARGIKLRTIPPAQELIQYEILNESQLSFFNDMRKLRNTLVHGPAADVPVEMIQGFISPLEGLLTTISEMSYIEFLLGLPDEDREMEIDVRLYETKQNILDSEIISGIIADTNASNWDLEDIGILSIDIDLKADTCRVCLTFEGSGEQDEDRMYLGTKLWGSAEAIIDGTGQITYQGINAQLESEIDNE